jgi:hypothetical protein
MSMETSSEIVAGSVAERAGSEIRSLDMDVLRRVPWAVGGDRLPRG